MTMPSLAVTFCCCICNVSIYIASSSLLLAPLVAVEVVDPGVPLGALLLARGELSHVPFVLERASVLLAAASSRPVGEVAVEDGRRVHL